MNVLIIEEDVTIACTLAEILELNDCSVSIANDMSSAQEKLSLNSFNIIFADHWTVRRGEGFDVLSNLKDPIPDIFILSSLKSKLDELSKVKYNKVLYKPFSMDDLLWCIQSCHCKNDLRYS